MRPLYLLVWYPDKVEWKRRWIEWDDQSVGRERGEGEGRERKRSKQREGVCSNAETEEGEEKRNWIG